MSEEFTNNSTNNLNLVNLNKLNFEAERATNDIYKKEFNSNMDETLEDRLQKTKELYIENQLHQFNKLKYEIEMQGRKILDLESFNLKVQDENMKLVRRIEDYQKLNKEWEFKVNNIRTNISDLEEKNQILAKESEELKEEIDNLNFKLKLSQEKEKLHETNLKNLKEIQLEYESKLLENKKEYKSKEDNLRKKYEIFEDNLNKKLKEQEAENIEKFQKLNFSFKETQKIIEKKDEEIWLLREKLKNSELFFTQKEQEFNDLLGNKDKKLKDLDLCIKKISEEARNQFMSLTGVIESYEKKFEEMKNKENKLAEELNYFKDSSYRKIKNDANQVNLSTLAVSAAKNAGNTEREILNRISSNKSRLSLDFNESEESKNRLIEKLRGKIRILEDENLKLSKDLSDVFRENERINEEYLALYNETKVKEQTFSAGIKQKDAEITQLTNKINELEINIERYEANLINIRKNYDNTVFEYQQEISRKNDDIKFMVEAHAKEIKEMQNKFEQVLIKENQFLNSLNFNSFGTPNSLNSSKNKIKNVFKENMSYNLKPVPDDEQVRNNISEQINLIKDKLDRTFYG